MAQSEIICGIYNGVVDKLKHIKQNDDVDINVYVNDLCQCAFDKNGNRIIVDEQQYEEPAKHAMCIGIVMKGNDIGKVLKVYGNVSVYIKDNPVVDISEWKWHGCLDDKIYLEPVIRKLDLNKKSFDNEFHKFELLYTIEFGLNSQKPFEFKRVEKREIRGYVKK